MMLERVEEISEDPNAMPSGHRVAVLVQIKPRVCLSNDGLQVLQQREWRMNKV